MDLAADRNLLLVLRDKTQSHNRPYTSGSGLLCAEKQYLHTDEKDQYLYGEKSFQKKGFLYGFTPLEYLFSSSLENGDDEKRFAWYPCPLVTYEEDYKILKNYNQETVPVEDETTIYDFENKAIAGEPTAQDSKLQGKKKKKTFDLYMGSLTDPKKKIGAEQPSLIIDDKYIIQVGPIFLHDSKPFQGMEAYNQAGAVAFLRSLLCLIPNPDTSQNYQMALELGKAPDGDGYGAIRFNQDMYGVLAHAEKQGKGLAGSLGIGATAEERKGKEYVTTETLAKGFICGAECTKAEHNHNGSSAHKAAHIHTKAFFFMNPGKDGSVDFEDNLHPECGDAKILRLVHLRWHEATQKWRWHTTEIFEDAQPAADTRAPVPPHMPDSPETPGGTNKPVSGGGGGGDKPATPPAPPMNPTDPTNRKPKNGPWKPKAPKKKTATTADTPSFKPEAPFIPKKPVVTDDPNEPGERDTNGNPVKKKDEPKQGTAGTPDEKGAKPGGTKNQTSFPSVEMKNTSSEAGEPTETGSNMDYWSGNYDFKNSKMQGTSGNRIVNKSGLKKIIGEMKGTKKQFLKDILSKEDNVLTGTLTGFSGENWQGKALTEELKGWKVKFSADGGIYLAPSDCSNQNTRGTGTNKTQLKINPDRAKIVFGYPRETEKAALKITNSAGDEYFEIDVSNIKSIILNGLPTSSAGLPTGAIWNDTTDSNRLKIV